VSGPDRLPLPDNLTAQQQAAVDAVSAGPRGALIAPFVPMLRSPELMLRIQAVGEFLRYQSSLPDALREVAILVVARHWHQDYEWGHHVPIARAAGVGDDVIAAVAADDAPRGPDDVCATWRLARETVEHGAVTDETFGAALTVLGDVAVVEIVVLTGYYTTLAMTMNVARTPVPDAYERIP
jgi:4-carboxymuconolactone decarboxylase